MTSLSRAVRSHNQKIVIFGLLHFLNCKRMSDLKGIPASNYDRKTDIQPFGTIRDIQRCLSLVHSLFKGRNAPIWCKWEPTHLRLSGTDGLRNNYPNVQTSFTSKTENFTCVEIYKAA